MLVKMELSDLQKNIDGMKASFDSSLTFHLPEKIDKSALKKITADSEILNKIIREHPEKVLSLINNASKGDMKTARNLAKEIGLTESQFSEKDGGLAWLAVAVAVAIVLYATDAW